MPAPTPPTPPAPTRWFDGHLDLAYLQQGGRDMTRSPADCGGEHLPAAVTFPSLRDGHVDAAIGTIFVQRQTHGKKNPWSFATSAEAAELSRQQLDIYRNWHQQGLIEILGSKSNPPAPTSPPHRPLQIVLMMEGLAGIERIEDFDHFFNAGVRVASLTWAEGTMWSGGNSHGGDITENGLELIAHLDELGVIHDVSHLSERAFWTLMEHAKGPKVATHSNARALLPNAKSPDRHLSDAQIKALTQAGGLIGINLYSNFLVADNSNRRATLDDVLRHIHHMEQLAGRRNFLCLGTDMDGGFSKEKLPTNLDSPQHLEILAQALSTSANWSPEEVQNFAWQNWTRLLSLESRL